MRKKRARKKQIKRAPKVNPEQEVKSVRTEQKTKETQQKCKLLLRKTQSYLICIKQQQGFRIDDQTPQKNGLPPGRPKGTEKGKEERDGKSRQETSEETASKVLYPAFGTLQPACKRKSPMLTELLSYQGTNGLDGLPARQKGNKKRGYPRLDRNILSYLKKRRLPTLPLCRQYHRRERA